MTGTSSIVLDMPAVGARRTMDVLAVVLLLDSETRTATLRGAWRTVTAQIFEGVDISKVKAGDAVHALIIAARCSMSNRLRSTMPWKEHVAMHFRLIHRGLPFAAAACLVALGGCASTPDVAVNYDRATNFSEYKTFAFASPLGTDRQGYQSVVSSQLKAATQRELEARGMRLESAAPQLLVNFSARLDEKLRVSTMPTPVMGAGVGFGRGYYGYRAGLYSPWPLYVDQTTVTPYTEGTLNIDLVDSARKQLIWEGVVKGRVTQKTLDNLQPAIDEAVAAAFEKYPIPGSAKAP